MSKTIVNSEIPNDVVENILELLPADSLIRFKSLNKYFSSLIQNPNFVSKQLHRRRKTSCSGFDHALILLPRANNEKGTRNNIFFLESPSHEPDNWNNVANEACPSILDSQSLRIVGHCDGLIFFSFEPKSHLDFHMRYPNNFVCNLGFLLWNPTLRAHKPLPLSRIMSKFPGIYVGNNCIGFGHDPQSKDYKIVRIASYYKYFNNPNSHFTRGEVYSLRANSWRPLAHTPPSLDLALDQCPHGRPSVSSGGFCHWVIRGSLKITILSFDLSNEAFRLVDVPEWVPQLLSQKCDDSRPMIEYFVVKPMLWNESLCVSAFPRDNVGEKWVDFWVLGRIDDRSRLDPSYRVPVEKFCTIRVDGLFEENNFYPELVWNEEMVSDLFRACGVTYNVKTKKIKYVSLAADWDEDLKLSKNLKFQISGYTKSLVPLD